MLILRNFINVALREFRIIFGHKIYIVFMLVMPILCATFFTTLMTEGVPVDIPVGVVDNDNTSMTRKLTRLLDSFQSAEVVAHYPNMAEARQAMQRGEIYAFVHFPENMTDDLLSQRQPSLSFYYSSTSLTAGSLLFKEMKTMATLAAAGVGQATLSAKGLRPEMIKSVLQPVAVDAHTIGNPLISYNIYLSNMMVPACFLLFVILLTPFSFGAELKFGTSKEYMETAGDNALVALLGKALPQTFIYLVVMYGLMAYMYGYLHFPAPGGMWRLALLGLLGVISTQAVGLIIFGLMPSMRMGMSISSLMGVLSFSMVGSAFPVFAMDAPLQALSWLFPLRHYYMIFQLCVFNSFSLDHAYLHILCMVVIAFVPLLFAQRIAKSMRKGVYLA